MWTYSWVNDGARQAVGQGGADGGAGFDAHRQRGGVLHLPAAEELHLHRAGVPEPAQAPEIGGPEEEGAQGRARQIEGSGGGGGLLLRQGGQGRRRTLMLLPGGFWGRILREHYGGDIRPCGRVGGCGEADGLRHPGRAVVHADGGGDGKGDHQAAQGRRPQQQEGPLGHPVQQRPPQHQNDGDEDAAAQAHL